MSEYKIPRIKLPPISDDLELIREDLIRNHVVFGYSLDTFSEKIKHWNNRNYCTLTSNGFSALFLAIKALNLSKKKIAIPAISTCFSVFNAIKATGNTPFLVDVDLSTANCDTALLKSFVSDGSIDAVIYPVHFGISKKINELKDLGIPVIIDNAQAIFNQNITEADLIINSFYPTKILNAVDGGAILSNSKSIHNFCEERVYYGHQTSSDNIDRFNFRFPNLHASVGLIFFKKLTQYKENLKEASEAYIAAINSVAGITYLGINGPSDQVLTKFILKCEDKHRKECAVNIFTDHGIETSNELIFMQKEGLINFQNSKDLLETTFSIPLRETLLLDEIQYVAEVIQKV